MIEESNTAKGKAVGTNDAEAKNSSFRMTYHSSPLPTISSIYVHKNWIRITKRTTKKVARSGPTKANMVNLNIFFTMMILSGKVNSTLFPADYYDAKLSVILRR